MKKNNILIQSKTVIYFVVAFSFTFYACSEGDGKGKGTQQTSGSANQSALSVEGMVVQTDKVDDKIFSTGTLLPNEEVELRPETSGRIIGIYFDEGSRVKKGQLLAKIDDSELEAQLKKLQVQKELAQSEESRQKQLLEINAVSQEEYDIALNQLSTIEAEISLIRTQIKKTNISSPFTGMIGLRNISQGGYVSPSSLIALMQQIDPVKLEFSVPEQYISEIKEGTSVSFIVTGLDEVYTAKVYAVDSRIDVNTRTVRVRARSSNPGNILKPGAFAKVEVVLKTYEDAILVPSEAIVTELEGQKIYIAKDGKAKSQKVKTGIRTERAVQIIEGLAPQDTVVLTGLMSIREGVSLNFKEIKEPELEVDVEQPNIAL